MVVKFAQLRSIFYACQTESSVAICTNRQSIPVRRVVDPQAGALEPPASLISTEDVQDAIYPPSCRKGTRAADVKLDPKHYVLDTYLQNIKVAETSPLIEVSPECFLSLLQQKYRDPRKFICIDLSRACLVKFSLALTESVLADVTSDVIILLVGFSEPAYTKLVAMLPSAPQYIIALEGSTQKFLSMYPFCHVESFFTMPGPTVVLHRPEKGFCLYLSDYRVARNSAKMLLEVFDVRHILNLTGQDLQPHYVNTGVSIVDVQIRDGPNRGHFYYRATRNLVEMASQGLPVLICDMSGYCHAPSVAALFMVLMGWTPDEVCEHLRRRRGETHKRKQLIDQSTIKGLCAYHNFRKSSGVIAAPPTDILTSIYPPLSDDIYNNDLAIAREIGIYKVSM